MRQNLSKIIHISAFKNTLFLLFLVSILFLSIRGIAGNPSSINLKTPAWVSNGPFELSPERGRFALLYSIIEDRSPFFSISIARFSLPDVAYTHGNYVSLFAPSVSFIVMPGYLIGKLFDVSQFGTFAVVSLFAIGNVFLIKKIAMKYGVSELGAVIAGIAFIFATPAFAYGVSLYQHHISTFLILLCIYILTRFNNFWSLVIVWFMLAFGVTVDFPNGIMMFPIGIYALGKFFVIEKNNKFVHIRFFFLRLFTLLVIIIPLGLFLLFNQISYQNPFQISGGLGNIAGIDKLGYPIKNASDQLLVGQDRQIADERKLNLSQFFFTRNLLNGFYEHFISSDRGMLYFTPVMFLGFLGLMVALRKKIHIAPLIFAIVGVNILLYSMWGDPYGGWAFGSRYLIPSYALLAIGIGVLLDKCRKSALLLIFFSILLIYSLGVNTLGAITSNANPPRVEKPSLDKTTSIKYYYTYQDNITKLNASTVKSFIYQKYAKQHVSAWQYYIILLSTLIAISVVLITLLYFFDRMKAYEKTI